MRLCAIKYVVLLQKLKPRYVRGEDVQQTAA